PREAAAWVAAQRARGRPVVLAATDERGDRDVFDFDFTQPVLLLVGTEGTGLSGAWRELSDVVVSIPMAGAASSLNAANAAAVLLYEASRQRLLARKPPPEPGLGRRRAGWTPPATPGEGARGAARPGDRPR